MGAVAFADAEAKPELRPMPTTATTDTVWATPDTATDTVWATLDTDTDMVWDTVATTARGPLTLSPPLLLSPRLMPMLTTATTDTVWDTAAATDTDTVWAMPVTGTATDTAADTATTARGLLMLSPLLSPRLMLT